METCNKLKTAEIKRFIDKLEKLEDLGIFSAIRKDSEGRWLVDGVHYVENRLMKDNELIEWFDSVKIHEFVHDFSKLVTDEKSVDEALDFIRSIDPGGNLAILFCIEITKRKGVYIVNDRERDEIEVYDTKEFIDYIKDTFKYMETCYGYGEEGVEYFLKTWNKYDSLNKFSLLKKLNDELKEIQLL
jgi:hypothetical protein